MIRFQVLTLFPELIGSFAETGLMRRAISDSAVSVEPVQLRDFAINAHGQVDDTPYGGGSGMVLRADAAASAITECRKRDPNTRVILFTPRGRPFTQKLAHELVEQAAARDGGYTLLCPRYEGVDERITEYVDLELSVGDYILMGGEVASLVVMEAISRLLPGVLGNTESIASESFENTVIEYPHYTKPAEFRGRSVPGVLLSGHHQQIADWRHEQALQDTAIRRPDLLAKYPVKSPFYLALIHHPVMGKQGEVITSSVTNLDLHDIARSSKTYGVKNYYVAHPVRTLRRLCEEIFRHWQEGFGLTYNANRSEALALLRIKVDLDDILAEIEETEGVLPKIITTSARPSANSITFEGMRAKLRVSTEPHLMLLGTGWGLAPEILERADYHLEPINGPTEFNHLSVRAAAAIMLDKLLG